MPCGRCPDSRQGELTSSVCYSRRSIAPGALPNESWAVVDRPYSLGSLTVGALYERPLFFCWAKRPHVHRRGGRDIKNCHFVLPDVSACQEAICRALGKRNLVLNDEALRAEFVRLSNDPVSLPGTSRTNVIRGGCGFRLYARGFARLC